MPGDESSCCADVFGKDMTTGRGRELPTLATQVLLVDRFPADLAFIKVRAGLAIGPAQRIEWPPPIGPHHFDF
jgi:hypothetical protein